ncbi:amidohydrolase [Runella sp. CRIBMP]|uniref:amidohydrolase n=1 Tax=Runella sp. CRIBMP TaxID=2683261 RepID=UPI001412DF35|nr:amidohydrolase [Runella sp. CRIBMP]NBB18468.1 amidohydrolase [Runella sp. CRIBMP]
MKTRQTTLIFIALLNLFSFQLLAQKSNYSELIANNAAKIELKVIAWRHDIHQNPELGNREFRTAELIAKHLQSLGIDLKTKVGVTGVVGILKGDKPGPVIALRADMDALPVEETNDLPFASKVKTMYNGKETSVMHACGHDAHVAILMGVAEVLASMKKELKGTIKFIFQPAEEGAPKGEEGGADLMVKEGVLENPKVEAIFGLHINSQLEVGSLSYRPAGFMAGASDFKITVKGKPSHGAYPWLSVDPILVSAQIITSLQQIVSRNVNLTENAAVVTIGSINGGNRSNIIPNQVEMMGTVRTLSNEDESLIYSRIKQIAEKTAEAAGATAVVEVPYTIRYPVTFNNPVLTKAMLPSLQKSAGVENVLLIPAVTGSEDFSFYAQKVPGLFFRLGGMSKGKNPKTAGPHHTPEFMVDDTAFKLGVITFCNLVFDYAELSKK